jgi:hypothetical protein
MYVEERRVKDRQMFIVFVHIYIQISIVIYLFQSLYIYICIVLKHNDGLLKIKSQKELDLKQADKTLIADSLRRDLMEEKKRKMDLERYIYIHTYIACNYIYLHNI